MKHDNSFAVDVMPSVEIRMREMLGHGTAASHACRHLDAGGNRVRARLALDTARILGLPEATNIAVAAASELLHNASLVHDDLQDGDTTRRGQPALWARFGAASALCAGDLLLSAAYAALVSAATSRTGRAVAVMHEAVAATIAGQVDDLSATSDLSFERAIDIAGAKSGPLIALPVRLCLILAEIEDDRHVMRAATLLASGYQIADDLSDLEGDRLAGTTNIVATSINAGHSVSSARARAAAYARAQLAASRDAARTVPRRAGLPLAALADRVETGLAGMRVMEADHAT
ncbi:Polyprenyl synthetase [Saliniramus fredricksonii]|uniref:Polyprenyl synthetase n=2 Tax=Saliniramus fredricksonii TaxID=1653334 RepID=A0ABY0KE93_9HYPH|nr:Polyprenyl synthetase [Saliniramus fredricksonii]